MSSNLYSPAQVVIRLPSLKLATLFLVLMFFFDIFWVFLSVYIFGESVMVHVATGGDQYEQKMLGSELGAVAGPPRELPMLIKFYSFWDDLRSRSMLGLGDIGIPGFLITYNLAVDRALRIVERRKRKEEREMEAGADAENAADAESMGLVRDKHVVCGATRREDLDNSWTGFGCMSGNWWVCERMS